MRAKLSAILIGLGILMILGAAGLLLYNQQESDRVASFSASIVPELSEYAAAARETASLPPLVTDPLAPQPEMPTAQIEGRRYTGVFSIPAIGYQVPVFDSCSESLLKLGACRFHGSTYQRDLVLCAHNYNRLYSLLTKLRPGDAVRFTDMDGFTWSYVVADLETLGPNMVEEMTDSGYDLSFFTCTYGGEARLTLRCVRN